MVPAESVPDGEPLESIGGVVSEGACTVIVKLVVLEMLPSVPVTVIVELPVGVEA